MKNQLSIAERHKIILDTLDRQGFVKVADLAKQFGVTSTTVRRDMEDLESRNLLHRTHVSATQATMTAFDVSTSVKSKVNKEIKHRIGKEAVKLVNANDSLFIASGSTVYSFAEQLAGKGPLTVITPSISVAVLLNEQEKITVKMLGGVMYKNSLSVRGEYAASGFENVVCDKLFFGVDGIDDRFGLTCATEEEAVLTKKFIAASESVIVLTDSSKFGRKGFGRICPLESVNIVITDDGIPEKYRSLLENAGVRLITVPKNRG